MSPPADKNRIVLVDSFYVWRVLFKIFKFNEFIEEIVIFFTTN